MAEAAVRAAVDAARAAAHAPLRTRVKGVAADVVTAADEAAERAAVRVLEASRPGDALLGEEGTSRSAGPEPDRADGAATDRGGGARAVRRWLVDGVDGTRAFAAGLPGWCSAVALEDASGPVVSAVLDPASGELALAARGAGATLGGRPARVAAARPLGEATVATFLRPDRLVLPGVRDAAHRLLDAAGLIRHAGPGSLELAWVAAGRLDAWAQPAVDPWDWIPGALLVAEGGGQAHVLEGPTRWHLAGPAPLVAELAALLGRRPGAES